jgi:hypothetical protein
MATTTNYGWTTPDDTALVKDGASAIRTLGSSVDTSVKALNPGTTAGDLDYYTAATTKARIAKGTAGQVFTMNSGATAPEWQTATSGGMTLLSTTTLSGATTTISSISQSYNSLFAIITGATNATADGRFRLAPNGVTTISEYISIGNNGTVMVGVNDYLNFGSTSGGNQNPTRTSAVNAYSLSIYNYTSTTTRKLIAFNSIYESVYAASYQINGGGGFSTNSAITSLVFSNSGGNHLTGTVLLYGVK